ncbi:ABC transporter ATP-binding protein [Enterococcus sp. BWT-B8]|uniref:ABC transporter ATP-binding protein n=1 Tax=Enterococcus sp. BWT-B8 TaxID=2885157 RepID=UPI001E60210F|nr:ABC transporter ATP-binding protein [Enterococcus sp. BWT-B8]MCB5952800.1 ABC transporter ATP-binding protein [Enterococcus sp. BWT-B8]
MELIIENLTVKIGKEKIIEHLCLQVASGEVLGVVAPNGTGKTTLFKTIGTLLPIEQGRIVLSHFDLETNRKMYLGNIFFIEGVDNLYENLTAREHLNYVNHIWKGKDEVDKILTLLQMTDYADKPVKKLSLGMKQHLLIGMYLASNATVLLFDEPLNGLDPTSVEIVNNCLKRLSEENKIILLSSHDLFNLERTCSRVVFMKNKKIARVVKQLTHLEEEYKLIFQGKGRL